MWASRKHVVILDANLELKALLRPQCQDNTTIRAVRMGEEAGYIAVAYGSDVEVFTPSSASNYDDIGWGHSVILTQTFQVNCLLWRNGDHQLIALGERISAWDCVDVASDIRRPIRNAAAVRVWTCSFNVVLPKPVDYASISPCGQFFATLSCDPMDYSIGIYEINLTSEQPTLKRELGRLLGRSFSQNLEFFGAYGNLEYQSLNLDDRPQYISWRQFPPEEPFNPNRALLVRCDDGSELIFLKDLNSSQDGSRDDFFLAFIQRPPIIAGKHFWWLHDKLLHNEFDLLNRPIGEGCASLICFPQDEEDTFICRLQGIELPSSVMIVYDRLYNISCSWNLNPKMTDYTFVEFSRNMAISFDYHSTTTTTAMALPVETFDGVVTTEPNDLNYEVLAVSIPVFKDPTSLAHSNFSSFGCCIGSGGSVLFSTETGPPHLLPCGICCNFFWPSKFSPTIFGLGQDGFLYGFDNNEHWKIEATVASTTTRIIGEISQDTLVISSGNDSTFSVNLSTTPVQISKLALPNDQMMTCVVGNHCTFLALSSDNGYGLKLYNVNQETCELSGSIPAELKILAINAHGDVAFLDRCETAESFTIKIGTLVATSKELLHLTKVDTIVEPPISCTWSSKRDLYIVLSRSAIKYSVGLGSNGNEQWLLQGTIQWLPLWPTLSPSDQVSSSVSQDGFLWLVLDGFALKLPPIQGKQKFPIPDKIAALRAVNYAIFDSFDMLTVQEEAIEMSSRRKTPCPSHEVFSFFDDISSLLAEQQEEFSEQPPSIISSAISSTTQQQQQHHLIELDDESHSITSFTTSVDTMRLSRLRFAIFEATKLLKEVEAAVDAAGAKYLFFARLSWEAAREVKTHGFEYLAASYSDAQEILISKTRELLLLGAELSWPKFSHFAMGLWVRNEQRLRELLEDVARTDFTKSRDPTSCAILYLVLGRRTLLKALWKASGETSHEVSRMISFLDKDFTDEHVQSVAAKNAFAALGKQRLRLAIIFFILASRLEDALQVCFERLQDYHLGFLIARFLCDSVGYSRMLEKHIHGNSSIPLCVRCLMQKVSSPEIDIMELSELGQDKGQELLESPGMCLPIAVAQIKKRKLPDDYVIPCILQLCQSGCYDLASRIVNQYGDAVPNGLAYVIESYSNRWPSSPFVDSNLNVY